MKKIVISRLKSLREQMVRDGVDACIIPSSDFHLSEYINDCFKYRAYFSGFTGSAGTLFVGLKNAYLITDGRYFLQAENQLSETGIALVRQGEQGHPDIFKLCEMNVSAGGNVFVDGRLVSAMFAEKLENHLKEKNINVKFDGQTVLSICDGLPKQTFTSITSLPAHLTGASAEDKISRVRTEMEMLGGDAHIIASLEENAWLFNLRGDDIRHTPVFYSYSVITRDSVYLFVDRTAISGVSDQLSSIGVTIKDYSEIYDHISKMDVGSVLIDKAAVNMMIVKSLPDNVKLILKQDPIIMMKAVKNSVEIENLRRIHITDGVAMVRFMIWLKSNDMSNETEISVADKLREFRKMSSDYYDDSFDTISAYGKNGAIVHYSATSESNAKLDNRGTLLVDSGGQYYGGTTDITRVFVLGETEDDFKLHYTSVCKSMLSLQNAVFPKGTKCAVLDMAARAPLWKLGIDFKHGTGHGIGYMLCVHEGPNRFHYSNTEPSLLPGMVTSDEPGVYLDGRYGIRLENEILCVEAFQNEYADFLGFDPLTICPIDLDGIDSSYLDKTDVDNLNAYHELVFKLLSPHLDETEVEWLKKFTRAL